MNEILVVPFQICVDTKIDPNVIQLFQFFTEALLGRWSIGWPKKDKTLLVDIRIYSRTKGANSV